MKNTDKAEYIDGEREPGLQTYIRNAKAVTDSLVASDGIRHHCQFSDHCDCDTDSGKAPSVAELENVVSAANTLIDFVIERNIQHTDILDGLNVIRSAAQNDIDDATGATY